MSVAERFKEERIRLNLTQTQVGDLLGKGKTTIINWEKSVGAPDAVQLFELSKHGFDACYVVTGHYHIAPIIYKTDGVNSNHVTRQELLNEREYALLDDFRALGDKEKDAAETMLHAVAKHQVKKKA